MKSTCTQGLYVHVLRFNLMHDVTQAPCTFYSHSHWGVFAEKTQHLNCRKMQISLFHDIWTYSAFPSQPVSFCLSTRGWHISKQLIVFLFLPKCTKRFGINIYICLYKKRYSLGFSKVSLFYFNYWRFLCSMPSMSRSRFIFTGKSEGRLLQNNDKISATFGQYSSENASS